MLLFATFAKADFELFIPTFIRAAKETVPDFKDVVVVRKQPSCLTCRITEEDYPDINRGSLELRVYFGTAGKYICWYTNPEHQMVEFGSADWNLAIIKKIDEYLSN